jgi:hypothetical protein
MRFGYNGLIGVLVLAGDIWAIKSCQRNQYNSDFFTAQSKRLPRVGVLTGASDDVKGGEL